MNMKCLMTASIFALVSASAAQAADIMVHHQPEPIISSVVPSVVVAPTFSWTGVYFGGQIGGFSSKTSLEGEKLIDTIRKSSLPKLSGFVGGLYAGYDVDLGNGLILGFDTDWVWSDKKDTTVVEKYTLGPADLAVAKKILQDAGIKIEGNVELKAGDKGVDSLSLEENWAGATRARIGFGINRIMPYIAGGVAYAQLKDVASISIQDKDTGNVIAQGDLSDETKTMIGYTLGAGVAFAMTDNIVARAEYRYSDFGKKKLIKDNFELGYKTNNFRVGVAYKF
ncbi:outer membrane protein [Bartonella sp. A05]|uniref:outer membrane protein n=1 Tax=Bartonella sp. A05 TaxID=2967261 RepID=UPI0022A8DF29|nr:outer membrane protein [Bartonella sp. A05]MCZ2203360.1 porin family protein [Bartonella sp. A05]